MKKLLLLCFLIFISLNVFAKDNIVRLINTDWKFITDANNEGNDFKKFDYNTSNWINMPVNKAWEPIIGKYDGYGWYSRNEVFTKEELKYKYIYMNFLGVDEEATIFVNGKVAFEHNKENCKYGPDKIWITPFYGNIKPFLTEGENNIKVKVFDSANQGGIYRPVYFELTDNDINIVKSTVELNPNFKDDINQALKGKYGATDYIDTLEPFSLFYFSDIHGDREELERLISFYNHYRNYFDDIILTGDVVENSIKSDFSFWDSVKGTEEILFVPGNHEVLKDEENWDWNNIISGKETYDLYMAPYIKNWNVEYEEGKPYFYKDYPKKQIRLIGIDIFLSGDEVLEQYKWFVNTLNDAKSKNLNVIIGCHMQMKASELVKIECGFSNIDQEMGLDVNRYKGYEKYPKYMEAVDDFMKNNGKFVCWIEGHDHKDCILYDKKYPNQLQIATENSYKFPSEFYNYTRRINGERSQDLANALVVDTKLGVIKIIRIGANRDRYLRDKTYTVIDYKNMKVIK